MTQRTAADPQLDVYGRADVALPTAEQSAAADRLARERHGIPDRVLMENAGRAAALVLHTLHPTGSLLGVAGSGHNGGDLLVMLRCLAAWGRDVTLVAAGSRAPDAALAHDSPVRIVHDDAGAVAALAGADVVIDGMLGTGSSGLPRGRIADWIERINDTDRPVVALDLPSGVDATTGTMAGAAIRADVTVTFGWPKLGLLLHPARARCGRLVAVEIGFPPACAVQDAALITPDWVRAHLPARAPTAHKGSAGRLCILGGSTGMAGAAAIAGEAALRAGVGLLRVASTADNREILQRLVPEATFLDQSHVRADDLEPMHALLAGPGMGTTAAAFDTLVRALELMSGRPVVLDADALNMFAARDGDALRSVAADRPVVITPHPLELSRLTGAGVDAITGDPVGAARAAAALFGCVVLLKGQPTLIADPRGRVLVNTTGSSDLATAGMGDQLAGTIAALVAARRAAEDAGGRAADHAAGLEAVREAAALGLFLAGRAADLCGLGRSLTPRDVSAKLALAFTDPGLHTSVLDLPFVTFDQPRRW